MRRQEYRKELGRQSRHNSGVAPARCVTPQLTQFPRDLSAFEQRFERLRRKRRENLRGELPGTDRKEACSALRGLANMMNAPEKVVIEGKNVPGERTG